MPPLASTAIAAAPPGSVILDNVEAIPTAEMVSHLTAANPASLSSHLATIASAAPQPQAASIQAVPTAAPPMTSSVAMTSSLTPLQYAAVLPGSRYQIQVNPEGSHQVIHVQQPPNVTVVTTTSTSASESSTTGNGSYTTGSHP